jgi:hypothetical protein
MVRFCSGSRSPAATESRSRLPLEVLPDSSPGDNASSPMSYQDNSFDK